ncbi:hypothetical protein [Frateuria soli]|uniref:hypothetical protein n=1 Tax=Frateuria soli TaxID=1542730 RepID=UPI001E65AB82|nr:hypothetical protein [Frateuria soli]UGB37695.1 hypothetical protein LQ771_12805 [Frateuria soli]
MPSKNVLDEAEQSLSRMQAFDPKSLDRAADLGRQMNFDAAVAPAERVVGLYKRIPVSILPDLIDSQLQVIKSQADSGYNLFKQMLDFSNEQNNAAGVRSSLLEQANKAYDLAFASLWQFVAFAVASATDTSVIEARARATLQNVEDRASELTSSLEERNKAAQQILDHIQKVAAEQGVSQQALFFKTRADEHEAEANNWAKATGALAAVIAAFAIFSAVAFKIDWLRPQNALDAAELLTGKVLLFLTLGTLLALCAKNFLAHKHNSILNRHRQTALQTYRVLVDSASSAGSQDIVLAQAAACIFGSQDTGFSKEGGDSSPGSRSVLELLTKSAVSGAAK